MAYETRLTSVNVALPEPVDFQGTTVETAIRERAVTDAVDCGPLGLEGDGVGDPSAHGGADKAVYAYSLADVAHWRTTLERPDLGPGTFGENLTLEDLPDDRVALGDVLRVGSARLQVTQPRQPCRTLALRLGLPRFPKQFTRSGRTGFYLRVVEPGRIAPGDTVACVERERDPLPVRALNAALLVDRDAVEPLRRALESPALSAAWRGAIEKRLARA